MYHIVLSILQFVFAGIAAYVAWWAMKKGLVQAALAATITALIFVTFSYGLHLAGEEIWPILEKNYVDHIFAIAGFLVFLWLIFKAKRAISPQPQS